MGTRFVFGVFFVAQILMGLLVTLTAAVIKVDLPTAFTWQGTVYGPGVTEVPEGLALALQPRNIHPIAEVPEPDADPMADFAMLTEAGHTADTVRVTSDDELLALPGVGRSTLKKIRTAFPSE